MEMQQTQPHNEQAEQATLASILIDPGTLDLVRAIVAPTDFYIVKNGWVYSAMLGLTKKGMPIDFVTLCDELQAREQLAELGGAAYLSECRSSVPTAMHAEGYARIVANAARRRDLVLASSDIAQLAYDEKNDVTDAETEALRILSGKLRADGHMMTAQQAAGELYDLVSAWASNPLAPGQVRGLAMGYRALDLALGGLDPDTLTVLAGRPGMGKSALAGCVAENVARSGRPAAIFSLEMSRRAVLARLACGRARVNWQEVKRGLTDVEKFSDLTYHISDLSTLPFFINDESGLTVAQVRAQVARLCARGRLGLVVLDHIGLMGDKDENEVRRIGNITWGLKRIAKDFGVPVLALSQLNRAVEGRDDKRPTLGDLRDSGHIEQNADNVLMMYREAYYNAETADPLKAEIIIRKAREGEANISANLAFLAKYGRFYDLDQRPLT
jgi:replicative DNA helicase